MRVTLVGITILSRPVFQKHWGLISRSPNGISIRSSRSQLQNAFAPSIFIVDGSTASESVLPWKTPYSSFSPPRTVSPSFRHALCNIWQFRKAPFTTLTTFGGNLIC